MEHNRIEAQIGELLTAKGLTFAAAESCTGGLVLHRMTNISGSSTYVLGGIVTYSNEMKMRFLKVKPETLEQFGAVSQECAYEMAMGIAEAFGAELALSVTGIAGPGGGTRTKPVGLTYIGMRTPDGITVTKHLWDGDREANKAASADAALARLLGYLKSLNLR